MKPEKINTVEIKEQGKWYQTTKINGVAAEKFFGFFFRLLISKCDFTQSDAKRIALEFFKKHLDIIKNEQFKSKELSGEDVLNGKKIYIQWKYNNLPTITTPN